MLRQFFQDLNCTAAILKRVWYLHFGAKIVHTNLDNNLFDLDKTSRWPGILYDYKNWEPCNSYVLYPSNMKPQRWGFQIYHNILFSTWNPSISPQIPYDHSVLLDLPFLFILSPHGGPPGLFGMWSCLVKCVPRFIKMFLVCRWNYPDTFSIHNRWSGTTSRGCCQHCDNTSAICHQFHNKCKWQPGRSTPCKSLLILLRVN